MLATTVRRVYQAATVGKLLVWRPGCCVDITGLSHLQQLFCMRCIYLHLLFTAEKPQSRHAEELQQHNASWTYQAVMRAAGDMAQGPHDD